MLRSSDDRAAARLYQLSQLLSPKGFVLSVTSEYPHRQISGPPFSISVDEMVSELVPTLRLKCWVDGHMGPESRLAQKEFRRCKPMCLLTKR